MDLGVRAIGIFQLLSLSVLILGGCSSSDSTPPDLKPENLTFTAQTELMPGAVVESNTVTITGINQPVPVTITGAEYKIGGGAYTSAAGEVKEGDLIRVRMTAPSEWESDSTATLTVGETTASFNVSTTAQDIQPNEFTFTIPPGKVGPSSVLSQSVTITGINDAAPVTISGGLYRIGDTGDFTSDDGVVNDGEVITIQVSAPATFDDTVVATLTVGGVSKDFTVSTIERDITPVDFEFEAQTGLALNATVNSNIVTIEDINDALPIEISGGAYRIGDGEFTTEAGTVSNGQTITLQTTSSSDFNAPTNVTVTFGKEEGSEGIIKTFAVTTVEQDVTPEEFDIPGQMDLSLGGTAVSEPITITGITGAVPVSITGGAYKIDDGDFTSEPGVVTDGQTVTVQLNSAAEFATTTKVTLMIGSASKEFVVETVARDITPDDFSFQALTDVPVGESLTSNSVTISGINDGLSVSVEGGAYRIGKDGAFQTEPGIITNGQSLTLQQQSSNEFSTSTTIKLILGSEEGINKNFTVTTLAQDITPESISFTSKFDVTPNSYVVSDSVVVQGVTGSVPLSVTGGEYSIEGAAFTQAAGFIQSGQRVQVRHVSALTTNTDTMTDLVIGDSSSNFGSVTAAEFMNTKPEWVATAGELKNFVITDQVRRSSSLETGDLNKDGHLDVLVNSNSQEKITWFLKNESGSYTEFVIMAENIGLLKIILTVDMDGDGDLDLISTSRNSDGIAWHENVEGSSYIYHQIASEEEKFQSISAADVDGDGDMDLLASPNDRLSIVWFDNNGAQSFAKRVISESTSRAGLMTAVDMDDDGDLDILAAVSDYKVAWFENDGMQNFTEQLIVTVGDPLRSLSALDIDGDGDMDVVYRVYVLFTVAGLESIFLAENTGSEAFSVSTYASIGNEPSFASEIVDIDGDGDLDVIGIDQLSGTEPVLVWYENSGTEFFQKHIITVFPERVLVFKVVDIDSDGDLELLVSHSSAGIVEWYDLVQRTHLVAGGTTLVGAELASDLDGNVITYSIVAGPDASLFQVDAMSGELSFVTAPAFDAPSDFDRDNNYELTVAASDGYASITRRVSVGVYLDDDDDDNDGIEDANDAFPLDPSESVDTDGDGIGNNADQDDDGDGTVDELDKAPLNANNTVDPMWSIIPEMPVRHEITSTAASGRTVFVTDVDGDGDSDVLLASNLDDTVAWYENNGLQKFKEHVVSTDVESVDDVIAADLDEDGDMDLLSASGGDHTIAWYENDGVQGFTKRVVTDQEYGVGSIVTKDLDGDGDTDIVSAAFDAETVSWFENDGLENFTQRMLSDQEGGAKSVSTVDLDKDGDLDVLSVSLFNNNVVWFENDGSQNFVKRVIAESENGFESVSTADMEGDGDLDLLILSRDNNVTAWLENNGEQSFSLRVISDTFRNPSEAVAADVDADGDIDVVVASEYLDTMMLYDNDGLQNYIGFLVSTENEQFFDIAITDLDRDGNLEVLSAQQGANPVTWFDLTQRKHQVVEQNTLVATEVAIDADGNDLTYSIAGGPDAALFQIDAATGDLSFVMAPSHAAPADSNLDNIYKLTISVSDGFSNRTLRVAVEVIAAE